MSVKKNSGGIIAMAMRYNKIVIFLVACLCAFGIYSLSEMRKNEFPDCTIRQGIVVAVCPGNTVSEIEQRVVKPLENYIFRYKEVNKAKTKSMSRDGIAYIQVQLNDNLKNKDEFWSKFKHGVADFKTELPTNVLAVKVLDDFGDTSAMLITLESDQKTYHELSDYMDELQDQLRGIDVVGRMSVYGMQNERIAIKVDHARLSQYTLSEKALVSKLFTQGFVTTGGNLKSGDYESPIHVEPSANTIHDISETVILSTPDGHNLRVKDLAEVVREYPDPTSYILNNGRKCLLLSIEMKTGSNMMHLGSEVNKVMDKFEKTLPKDVSVYRITDQSKIVGDSIGNFLKELLIAIIAVVVVVLSLLPFRVAVVSGLTIPITIFISLGLFYIFGIELNIVTLAALIVMLGMIVDNSIVIIDNYMEQLSEGVENRWEASINSAKHFFVNIIYATLAISVTFFPFLFTTRGMCNDFLQSFPWAATIVLFVSLLIAVMLVPFLQYLIIRAPERKDNDKPAKKDNFKFILWLQSNYDRALKWCFGHPRVIITIGIFGVAVGAFLMSRVPQKLLPVAERDQFAVEIFLPSGSSLDKTAFVADSLEKLIRQDNRVVSVASFVGSASPRFHNLYAPQIGGKEFAQMIVNTTGHDATVKLLNKFTSMYSDYFPEALVRFKQLSYIEAQYPVEIRFSGTDRDSLSVAASRVEAELRKDSRLLHVRTDLNEPLYSTTVYLDRYESSRLGIANLPLEIDLASRYGDTGILPVATLWEDDYKLPVVVESTSNGNATISALVNEKFDVNGGLSSAHLRQFANVGAAWEPGQLSRRNGMPTVTIMADVARGYNTVALTKELGDVIAKIDLPENVTLSYGGEIEEQDETLPNIMNGLYIAVIIIFLILLSHYKNLGMALFIVLCLASSLLGAAIGMMIHNIAFGMTCVLGLVAIMGIIVRNGIIMIDYAQELQHQGVSVVQSIYYSAKRRMRPIFLTSAAASIGVIPMILSRSGLWMPMGVVIFYGTLITMLFIVLVIPVAYMLLFHGKEDYKTECKKLD